MCQLWTQTLLTCYSEKLQQEGKEKSCKPINADFPETQISYRLTFFREGLVHFFRLEQMLDDDGFFKLESSCADPTCRNSFDSTYSAGDCGAMVKWCN
jgi:hypothetical protein